jgi:hypothetical protein
MIVNKNITPDRDLYYLGGKVIEVLLKYDNKEIDYFDLYQKMNKELNISINLYTLVLDWLFIIGTIKNADKGLIKKCF